jgi:hypothetical protein
VFSFGWTNIEGGHEGRGKKKDENLVGLGENEMNFIEFDVFCFSDDQQNIFYEMKEFRWKEKRKA